MTKSIFRSKTFYLNLAWASASYFGLLPLNPILDVLGLAGANLCLRYVTKEPVHLF